jgi:hypothetical protein
MTVAKISISARIHGYDYKFLQAADYPDRHGTWIKVPMMKEALKTYDIVVFVDSDVMFPHLELPLEWLMNYWNITPDTLIAMATAPDFPQNKDSQGNVLLNTGFVIVQRGQHSSRIQEMFEVWEQCPEETRYAGCSNWKFEWSHEQAAFGNYIRYDFNDSPDSIRVIPCTEANGSPAARDDLGCGGELIRHYWHDKALPNSELEENIARYFVPRLHELFVQESPKLVVNERNETHASAHPPEPVVATEET